MNTGTMRLQPVSILDICSTMGLVLLEIGMWRILSSIVLRDVPLFDQNNELLARDCKLGDRLVSLTMDMVFARQGMAHDPDPDTEEEHSRLKRTLAAYVEARSWLAREEELIDTVFVEGNLDDYPGSST